MLKKYDYIQRRDLPVFLNYVKDLFSGIITKTHP